TSTGAASRAGVSATNGQIAWMVPSGGIGIANPDGTARHVLHTPWQEAAFLVWSPDGSRLLVTVPQDGLARPATLNADGSDAKLLDATPKGVDVECRAWSPDGTRLLCDTLENQPPAGRRRIFSIRASDGGDLVWLTDPPASHQFDFVGDYSPDGSRFVF